MANENDITKLNFEEAIQNLSKIVDGIEEHFFDLGNLTVPSKSVGEEIMKRLKELDEVAYVRFASVYRDFKDKEEFLKEVKDLKDTPKEKS